MNRLFLFHRIVGASFFLWGFALSISAQNNAVSPSAIALQFLRDHAADMQLQPGDLSELQVMDAYPSRNNGLTHVWIQQRFHSIPVFNGLIGLHVASAGKVLYNGHRFVRDLSSHVNTDLPSLSASRALEIALINLGFEGLPTPALQTMHSEYRWTFEAGVVSQEAIEISACYARTDDARLRLAWSVRISPIKTADVWDIQIDAVTGAVLHRYNLTNYCHVNGVQHDGTEDDHFCAPADEEGKGSEALLQGEQYRVFKLPVESPGHGSRELIVNPADLLASPFGWLDTNGVAGEEFTYTRGNNAWAFDDAGNDGIPDPAESADAGPGLNFDFPYDPGAEPATNRLAALTNLFYANNFVHDWTYHFGFDEAAGNFQYNNYDHQGIGRDQVYAHAFDGDGTNNSTFVTKEDGKPGAMHMYLWTAGGGKVVSVNAPGVVVGVYQGNQGSWGGAITTTPITADVVFANDGIEPTLACEPLTNNVAGKIVMVDRGVCDFSQKALFVQQAGGVACIVCDHEAPPIAGGFGPGAFGNQVQIPAMYMSKADCDLLRQHAGAGLNISLVQPSTGGGPAILDGSLDNGIIVHEYGHGISNRLTGGPANVECLVHNEQMGEGWSDFLMLAATVRPGDTGATKRGVGTFVARQSSSSRGIRRYPYSTDMSINPLTFAALPENPEKHALGEIWAVMLWDLYWAMVEKYGYDQNSSNLNSGNARAIQLVMDGMKLQPCWPGFVDARDAIMTADLVNYAGADSCLISTVFARRGLGYQAQQGSIDVATDGVAGFDPIPVCVKELKIKKTTTTPVLKPGETAEFLITVTNHKGVIAPAVTVTDELPAGLSFVSASHGGALSGNTIVWNLGDMPNGQEITLSYSAKTDAGIGSQRIYHDIMDNEDDWYSITLDNDHIEVFELQQDEVHSGQWAWNAPEPATYVSDFVLEKSQPVHIDGARPILRFWHKYNTEPGGDAGFLEFRDVDDPNASWQRVTQSVTFRNGYPGKVSYQTFALANHYGFSGNSQGWQQSYFDMSQFSGKNIRIRFRFGTNSSVTAFNGGWVVDEVELMDMIHYDTEACVSSGADHACDRADARGVIMDPITVDTDEPSGIASELFVQPNPASGTVYLSLTKALSAPAHIRLVNSDGRLVLEKSLIKMEPGQVVPLDIRLLPAGLYWVQVECADQRHIAKLVIL